VAVFVAEELEEVEEVAEVAAEHVKLLV